MKFIKINYEETYDKDTDVIVVRDAVFDKAVEVIRAAGDAWKEMSTQERYDGDISFGGFFDYVAYYLDHHDIEYNWLSYDNEILVRG